MVRVGCSGGLYFPPGPTGRIADMVSAAVIADAVRRYDADLAQSVETCRDWGRAYRRVFRGMTALAASAPDVSLGIAADGLRAMRAMLHVTAGRSVRPLHAVELPALGSAVLPVETAEVAGTAKPAERLEVPLGGEVLAGDRLRRQLREWQRRGVLEPGFATAVDRVVDHPEWLSLPGFRIVVTGADAALGPLRPLLRWGAHVSAIDLPGHRRWEELRERARAGAGRLRFPVLAGRAGADLVAHLPSLVQWVEAEFGADVRPVLGRYATASGPAGVRVAAATDLLTDAVSRLRPETALAQLGSPADCYAVPFEVLTDARERLARYGFRGAAHNAARLLSGSTFFRPNYRHELTDEAGQRWGVADLLPPTPGPNYALAQRLPRWRAQLSQAQGRTVSHAVAPLVASRTARDARSTVVRHGCARYGIEFLEPGTARTLLAAKLVADLLEPPAPPPNPESLFTTGAFHSGLWRLPYEPRSVPPVAAAIGRIRDLRSG
ncbi:hypothetical protein [Nocardia sp. BMG51109]|uniref:hypothetical protein n=1 Tax=Nocardia sp. BMG51109 TaxID=1056816 RepID=UPI0004ACC38C|nr:hypothetical protein [Nocardia sp. BMG51109]